MTKNSAQRHPDWFAMSVYEDPENLMPATNRILVGSTPTTLILNAAVGYLLSAYSGAPWVQDLVTFVLGLSDAFATRFHDLQGLTQTGGYYYVGSMVVSLVAAVITGMLLVVAYVRITLSQGRARPFELNNFKGLFYGIVCAGVVVFVTFFWKIEIGPYLGMSRVFFPATFPIIAALSATFCAMVIALFSVSLIKLIRLWRGRNG